MKTERRDHRNRLLRGGESQCKEGRYRYTYYESGKQKAIYSWKLELKDKLPVGKRDCVALRVQIENLQKKQLLCGRYSESSFTVLDLVECYIGMKADVRKSTQTGYKTVVNVMKKEEFRSRKISDCEKAGESISEFCGLTIHDIDMKERNIAIAHQLQRLSDIEYITDPTKTNSGKGVLPMTVDVYECFQMILKNRKTPKQEPMEGKHVGFLYLDKNGMPMVALHWQKYFDYICEKYNKIYREQIPKMTPHVCRHPYCTNMVLAGMNLKIL